MEKISPIVLCVGDRFLAEKQFQSFLQQIRQNMKGEIVVQTLRLSDVPLDKIIADARSLPFLAVAQVFRLRESDALKEKKLESLERYLSSPSDFSYLFFEAEDLENSHPLVEIVSKSGQVFFLKDAEKKMAGTQFVHEKLKRAGKTIAPEALASVTDQVGDAPAFLDSLVEQLILYAGDQKEITESMVEAFEENWRTVDAFSLTDAISNQKPGRALEILKALLEENEGDFVSLVGLLHWQVRRLWQVRVLLDEGMPENIVMKKCRVSPKQAPFLMRQVRAFTRQKIEKVLEGLFQLDWKAKTGRVEGPLGLETWIVETTSRI